MASLRKRRNIWYSRIQTLGQKEINIPLKTARKVEARLRHAIVEKAEEDIKSGLSFRFPWQKQNGGNTTLEQLSLEKAVARWLITMKNTTSDEHCKRCKISMDRLMDALGVSSPVSQLNTKNIEEFKNHWNGKHAVAGINLNLRNIKVFLHWCIDSSILHQLPKMKMLKELKKLPQYITEKQWNKLMLLESISPFMKRAFSLYRSTGCRRREIIDGVLDNSFLIIPSEVSKSRVEYHVKLETWQVDIIKEIHLERKYHLEKGSLLVTFKNKFTKAFQDACIELGIYKPNRTKLHCLRDTYAVMKYLLTRDIYQVKMDLHHSSVKTTEIYARFDINKLKEDFPSLVNASKEIEAMQKKVIQDTVFQDTHQYNQYNPSLLK